MALRPLVRRLAHCSRLWQVDVRSNRLRQLSQEAQKAISHSKPLGKRGYVFLAGLGSCAVVAWGLSRTREGSRFYLLPAAKAGGKGKGGEQQKPKISARELRYKVFASYVYKGEPYMSARDFLESLIRDEPRCKWVVHNYTFHLLMHPHPFLSLM